MPKLILELSDLLSGFRRMTARPLILCLCALIVLLEVSAVTGIWIPGMTTRRPPTKWWQIKINRSWIYSAFHWFFFGDEFESTFFSFSPKSYSWWAWVMVLALPTLVVIGYKYQRRRAPEDMVFDPQEVRAKKQNTGWAAELFELMKPYHLFGFEEAHTDEVDDGPEDEDQRQEEVNEEVENSPPIKRRGRGRGRGRGRVRGRGRGRSRSRGRGRGRARSRSSTQA